MKKLISTILLSASLNLFAQTLQTLKNINPTSSSLVSNYLSFNNKIYFTADDGNSKEIWESDGNNANTKKSI